MKQTIIRNPTTLKLLTSALITLSVAVQNHTCFAQQETKDLQEPAKTSPDAATMKRRIRIIHKRGDVPTPASATTTEAARSKRFCIIDQTAVNKRASVSVASNQRLAELRAAAQKQIETERAKLAEQIKPLVAELSKKPDDVALKRQRDDVLAQAKSLSVRADLYGREIEATRQLVTKQMQTATMPLVGEIAHAKECEILLTSDVVVEPGNSLDLTQFVVEAMNAKLRPQPFDLVKLDELRN